MVIGVDLSPLQNAHRMRGIGYTLINFINHLNTQELKNVHFIFYSMPEEEALFKDPLELLELNNIVYELRFLKPSRQLHINIPRLNFVIRFINKLLSVYGRLVGESRISNLKGVDVFLQADQNQTLPRNKKVKKVLIIYDVIPHVIEWDYLWSYSTSRLRGKTRTKSFLYQIKRLLLARKTRNNIKRSDKLLAISETTKEDFINLFSASPKKITVIPLGVPEPKNKNTDKDPVLKRYLDTEWGYIQKPVNFDPNIPYLLFVGGTDRRRKLEDLVAVFNNLRAQGHMLKLVLAGDVMLGPDAVTTKEISKVLKESSYLEDIIFMGFIDDDSRDWLYKHALAFVFPSKYEGFGLPVLEAMIHDCLVISYENAATVEVAKDAPIYVHNFVELFEETQKLLSGTYSKDEVEELRKKGKLQAEKYTWSKTSSHMLSEIMH